MIKSLFLKLRQNHLLAMMLCCAIPIVGILALSASGALGSWAYFLVFLLCPLGHIFMMRGMHSHSGRAESRMTAEANEIEHE